ncbi:hypothetical protein [Prauserella flavalba]|uniref:Uncharacterized protein n=1 Tax=Prauserella flavalba TaxID=1477506 RepID=A0A318LF54_9PSEU|nr:hypothetical protein [Prauserella flavalba]PXY17352.1 hypothetical protein BA062_37720 [Prauserella flavalba]
MSEQEIPQRPPTSGPGSGVAAWREYAAAVTDSPAESWASLSREEIIDLLAAEGVEGAPEEQVETDSDAAPAEQAPVDEPEPSADGTNGPAEGEAPAADVKERPAAQPTPDRPAGARRPVWMVPTADGWVPEHHLQRRR